MNYNETLELLQKIAKSCENVALLKGRGSSCTVIVFEDGYEYRHIFTPDHLKKTVTDPEGRTLYEGNWLIGEDAVFSFDEDWGGKSMLRLESGFDTLFTAYFPAIAKDEPEDEPHDGSLHIYTDGSCRMKRGAKTGHGAWAFLCIRDGGIVASASNYMPHTTSGDMELLAVAYALKTAKKMEAPSITITTDSRNIVEMMNRGLDPEKDCAKYDRDIWARFMKSLSMIDVPVTWDWVKGHNGDRWNEEVNSLVQSITQKKLRPVQKPAPKRRTAKR